jgi:hypothetical protein
MGLPRGVSADFWSSHDAWFHGFGFSQEESDRSGQFDVVRLKPGVSAAHAAALLDAAIRGEGKHKPAKPGSDGTDLIPRHMQSWGGAMVFGGGLLLILGAVLFVACANVAQLRLAQSESRKKKLSVRLALGAGAWRITRQLLVETGEVSLAGAGMGGCCSRKA